MYRKGGKPELYRMEMLKSGRANYYYKEKASTYMKYLRVVRKYIQEKYNISLDELEMILFLYDENIFDRTTFLDYSCIMGFNSIDWLSKLKKKEIVKVWRDEKGYKHLYTLSQKYKIACRKFYNHLEGEPIPTNPIANPIFKGDDPTYTEKLYRKLIMKMNKKREEDGTAEKIVGTK